MNSYNFTLILEGPDLEEHLDTLFEAGFDDALFGTRGGQQFAEFERQAPSFGDAVFQALRTIEASVPDLTVTRVEPDDLVTQSKIAERTNRSRESVRLLIRGERGSGDFPAAAGYIDSKTQVWHWSEVAAWFEHSLGEMVALAGGPLFVRTLNGALEVRSQVRKLSAVAAETEQAEAKTQTSKVAFTPDSMESLRSLVEESAKLADQELAAV